MAKTAYFRIEHASYNRKEWGYGRVAAAAHYGHNLNKRGHVVTVNLPLYETSYDAERGLQALEELNTRKNARLGDTLVVCLPIEVSAPHRKEMMERLLWRITFGGRTFAQAWEHVDKPGNPHFHVVLIDRDYASGESVGKFGNSRSWRAKHGLEPNVTEWMRKQWEEAGNEFFEEYGYSLRFDRRSNLEQGLEPPGEHRGWDNDNSQPAEDLLPADAPPEQEGQEGDPLRPDVNVDQIEETAESEDDFDGDSDMAKFRREGFEPSKMTPVERVREAKDLWESYSFLKRSIADRDDLVRKYETARQAAEDAAVKATMGISVLSKFQWAKDRASERIAETHRADGRRKGFKLAVAGYTLWETKGHKSAVDAEERLRGAEIRHELAKKDLEGLENDSLRLSTEATELKVRSEALERSLRILGSDQALAQASEGYLDSIKDHIGEMSLAELMVMIDEGEITPDECEDMLRIMGRKNDLEEFQEAERRRDQSESEDGGYSL